MLLTRRPTARRFSLMLTLALLLTFALTGVAHANLYWANTGNSLRTPNTISIAEANTDGTGANQSFITGQQAPVGVAVAGGYVYWTDAAGTIGRASLNGTGANDNFITGASHPLGVAVAGNYIYWTNYASGTIGRANLDGSGVNQSWITGLSGPWGIAASSNYVYFSAGNGQPEYVNIERVGLDGSGLDSTFIQNVPGNEGIAVDSNYIYYDVTESNPVGIMRANIADGSSPQMLVSSVDAYGVAVDANYIYWTNYAGQNGGGLDTLGRASLNGSNINNSFISGANSPTGIAVSQPGVTVSQISFRQPDPLTGAYGDVPASGTIDGNRVDVVATLNNSSASPVTSDVTFGNPADNSATVGTTQSNVTIPANGTVQVDEVLNTSGLAWTDTGAASPNHTITVAAGGASDSATLIVRPKPVILVHGLASDWTTWSAYLGASGFLAGQNLLWRGYAVGDGQAPGVMNTSPFTSPGNTIAQNAQQEATYIQGVREATGAEHVDIVAHSMGGLISRDYIQDLMPNSLDSQPVVSHLVMLGTPNEGSDCAYDAIAAQILFGRGVISAINAPLFELEPTQAAVFNAQVTNRRDVPFSILAGDGAGPFSACTQGGGLSASADPNDGVVTVTSAEWTISDRTVEPLIHTQETSSATAFTSWVMPHLALGPTAAGGGNYISPLASLLRRAADLRHSSGRLSAARLAGRRPSGAAGSRLKTTAKKSKKSPKLCLATTPEPALAAGGTESVSAGHATSLPISVPADAGAIEAVVLADPSVTTTLVDPHGHVVETVAAGSLSAGGLFRTLSASKPRAGTWHLTATEPAGSAAGQIDVAVHFTRAPLVVKLSVTQSKGGKAKLTFVARITDSGHALTRTGTVEALLLVAGKRPLTLRLRAVNHHAGEYASATTKKLTTPIGVIVRAQIGAATTSAQLQLQSGGCH